jgi:hypothetical protein
VEAHQALRFASDAPQELVLTTKSLGDGCFETVLTADILRRDGRLVSPNRTFFSGRFVTHSDVPSVRRAKPDVSGLQWRTVSYVERGATIWHGPDLQCLRETAMTGEVCYGRIAAPAAVQVGGEHRPSEGWSVPCAAMDACLYAAALLGGEFCRRLSLPVRFGRIRWGRLPDAGEPCLVKVEIKQHSDEVAELDFILWGLNGDVILDVERYTIGWLRSHAEP